MAGVFNRPMLATEHGAFDSGAEALAFALAKRCLLPLSGVLPVVSNPEYEMVAPQIAARADADAATKRQHLLTAAADMGVPLDLQVRRGAEIYLEFVDAARERGADLIIVRRRGQRGLLANLLVGEMVSKLVAHAPCSVLIAPRGARLWSRRVLVGVDPQDADAGAVALAARLAHECALPLRVLCAAGSEADREAAALTLATAMAQARALHDQVDGEVQVGRPHQTLIDAAQAAGADLLVVARHGGTALARAWIGGTAQKVIGLARCPVLVHVEPTPSKTGTP